MSEKIKIIDLGKEKENKMYDKRIIVYGLCDGMKIDEKVLKNRKPLYMKHDCLEFINPYQERVVISLKDIDRFVLKMAARFHIFGVFSEFRFYLDFDIYVGERIYKFEVQNMQTANDVIDYLKQMPFQIEDPIGVFDIFENHRDTLARTRWLQANFKKIAKKHGLDYPRQGASYN